MISIRRARGDEAVELSALAMRSKSHWPYPKDYLERCPPAMALAESDIVDWPAFVAELDERVIGFFALKPIKGENRLDHLWIEPEWIGRGVGRLLLARAFEEARRLGWKTFRLAADPYALGFYTKLGARKIGEVQSRIKTDLFLPHLEFDVPPLAAAIQTR